MTQTNQNNLYDIIAQKVKTSTTNDLYQARTDISDKLNSTSIHNEPNALYKAMSVYNVLDNELYNRINLSIEDELKDFKDEYVSKSPLGLYDIK